MGVRVEIAGQLLQVKDYTVHEESTPLSAADSNGSVGTIDFTLQPVDPYAPLHPGWEKVRKFGIDYYVDEEVTLVDGNRGSTLGTVRTSGYNDDGTITLSCVTRLGKLNAYNIQAQPFIGTLGAAFQYYTSLAGETTGILVDEAIASRPVVFPGFTGELWFFLKQMSAAQDCEIALVSDVILLRPIRTRVAIQGRDISRTTNRQLGTLAQFVEVYQYNNRQITNELVYPPGGYSAETNVFNVNAGETQEYELQLSASVSSIQEPVMVENIGPEYDSASVFTIIADDNLPVSPALWSARGGYLKLEINPDTTSLKLTIRGPVGVPTSEGIAATIFSIALSSDEGSRYSTLRIVGTGVAFEKKAKRISTGVPPSRTGTEVGVTIDNPFISDIEDLYRAGGRAAKQYAGSTLSLSGTVTSINRRGDGGSLSRPSWGDVQNALYDILDTPSYGDVQDYYEANLEDTSYGGVQDYWQKTLESGLQNQVYGNVAGARVWDVRTKRWYRIRISDITGDQIPFTGDEDTTYSDVEEFYLGQTYGDLQAEFDGLTYQQVEFAGLHPVGAG